MLRSDREATAPIPAEVEAAILSHVSVSLPEHDVVVLSDYAKGVLTPTLIREVVALAARRGVPVIVDPKSSDLARYDGATRVTPNLHEIWLPASRARATFGRFGRSQSARGYQHWGGSGDAVGKRHDVGATSRRAGPHSHGRRPCCRCAGASVATSLPARWLRCSPPCRPQQTYGRHPGRSILRRYGR